MSKRAVFFRVLTYVELSDMNNSTKDCQIIDMKTGEVVSPVIQLQILQEAKSRLYQGYFTSAHQDRHLAKSLTNGALRLSMYLKDIMSKGNYISVSYSKLGKELSLTSRQIGTYMRELKRLDVIRGRSGRYMYNPRIAINGGMKVMKQALENYHRLS